MTAIERGDRLLLRIIDDGAAEAARRAGPRLTCRIGCTECCLGPFPITQLDAWRLRRALEELARSEPGRAARIRDRARRSWAALAELFPGDARTGVLGDDDQAEERFAGRFADLPCPVLDPETGACELYQARPISCRTFGPPVRIGQEALPPCRLCFAGAGQDEIEACRVAVDPQGLEDALLACWESGGGPSGETIVAFALAHAP